MDCCPDLRFSSSSVSTSSSKYSWKAWIFSRSSLVFPASVYRDGPECSSHAFLSSSVMFIHISPDVSGGHSVSTGRTRKSGSSSLLHSFGFTCAGRRLSEKPDNKTSEVWVYLLECREGVGLLTTASASETVKWHIYVSKYICYACI